MPILCVHRNGTLFSNQAEDYFHNKQCQVIQAGLDRAGLKDTGSVPFLCGVVFPFCYVLWICVCFFKIVAPFLLQCLEQRMGRRSVYFLLLSSGFWNFRGTLCIYVDIEKWWRSIIVDETVYIPVHGKCFQSYCCILCVKGSFVHYSWAALIVLYLRS